MQNINLYTPELRPAKIWLDAQTALILIALFGIVLTVFSARAHYKLEQLEQGLYQLDQEADQINTKLADLRKKNNQPEMEKLDLRIEELRQTITNRALVSNLMAGQNLGNNQGYSEQLVDLAKVSTSAIAITEFRFSHGNSVMEIKGDTENAATVAEFIDQLAASPSYQNTSFGSLSMSKAERQPGVFHFNFGFTPLFNHASQLAGPGHE